MSLVSTYVEASDGLFYREPILSAPGWYICWDDDDPIELVIDMEGAKDKGEAKKRLLVIIEAIQLYDLLIMPTEPKGFRWSDRLYPPDWKKFRKSMSVFVEIVSGQVPVELITKHNGTVEKDPETGGPKGKMDCVYYKAKT